MTQAAPDGWPTQEPQRQPERNWFARHKVLTVLGALVVVVVIAAAASNGGGDGSGRGGNASPEAPDVADRVLFPGRPDAQPEDQERNLGESAAIDGLEVTVKTASFQQRISDFETAGYVVADVNYTNRADSARPYNIFDWKLQRPGGVVENAWQTGAALANEQLGSGDLVPGGTLDAKVVFEVGAEKGDFYFIWKPNAFDAARGVWKATI